MSGADSTVAAAAPPPGDPQPGRGDTAEPSEDAEPEVSLVRFRVKECYLYSIPPASSIGHRAETWDVDNWMKALSLRVMAVGDKCFVRLYDIDSEELFAECPLPDDHTIFHTAVEAVIDSSRYFALKIVDAESGRHAFIGIGFRERGQASDFNAALDDHRSFLRRQQEASKLVHEREEAEQQPGGAPGKDLSIKGTIHIDMRKLELGPKAGKSFLRDRMMSFTAVDTEGLLPLPPPPSGGTGGFWKAFNRSSASPAASSPAGKDPPSTKATNGDDDWGDFQG
mmetsp:Transcript_39528/g.112088  ORF Transcript_39528/g.112088 Transcript_39528/m.112088 type:complete len:282 (-) Transcript_39528:72-917(-)|eukprot:CAMPEP_0117680588 /NCGR_PEP_ID=MMETSP0804-20121206/18443_1 /TAXON_ID=1074897 /ORGANISM="Tetraselmis astigmatica, Strain CCMP880" /LENGTH=281 /DNA_ID=CAMNT_0005490117 /DNA_START=163 /DNA_END=1008 /DNA_ORIENTATION=-